MKLLKLKITSRFWASVTKKMVVPLLRWGQLMGSMEGESRILFCEYIDQISIRFSKA